MTALIFLSTFVTRKRSKNKRDKTMTDNKMFFETEATGSCTFGYAYDEELYSEVSPFQTLRILNTPVYGRMLLLDDHVMLTESDEFIYHEMIAHVPMAFLPSARKVLIIGGGDGGT